ncbi:MAG: hypothetical protein JSR99_00010 [Proteobacteria bacterium]|nr:hypothetical protein [Pseudomonadota bacterium]
MRNSLSTPPYAGADDRRLDDDIATADLSPGPFPAAGNVGSTHVNSCNGIDAVVRDYQAGRIDAATFHLEVAAWKDAWHQRLSGIMPDHHLSAALDPETCAVILRLTPKKRADLDLDGPPKHLLPTATTDKGRGGPSR